MATSKENQSDEIHFTLKVSAKKLEKNLKKDGSGKFITEKLDQDFKIKIAMDFTPDFNTNFTPTNPNFNANRVQEILQFVAEDVIEKVIEHIYFKHEKPAGDQQYSQDFNEAEKIYQSRKKGDIKLQEPRIKQLVQSRLNDPDRFNKVKKESTDLSAEENITRIRFELLSPGRVSYDVQTIVNGDTCPPR